MAPKAPFHVSALRTAKRRSSFEKRLFFSLVGLFSLFFLLLVRLFFLQIVNNKKYALLSDKNRIYTLYTNAPRGTFYDRKGRKLAQSLVEYQATVDLNDYVNSKENWETLCQALGLDTNVPFSFYVQKQHKITGPAHFIALKSPLSWDEIVTFEMLSSRIPGVLVLPKRVRFYPHAEDFCHIIGYVTQPTQKDIEKNANLKVLGSALGKMGLEMSYDATLQGTVGSRQLEMNAARHVVRVLEETSPLPGQDVYLTLDGELQKRVREILKDVRRGAAVVMDVRTGDILASVSVPTFNPKEFTESLSPQQWKDLSTNPDFPLINRVVSGQYAPGSTFKMIVALAALEAHVISAQTRYFCPGYYDAKGIRVHCWRWRTGGHGWVNLVQALEQSCDVFFYNAAVSLGGAAILETAKPFGFGQKVQGDLLEEKAGQIPVLSKKFKHIGPSLNVSIGQGSLTSTPLQLVTMTARLATGKKIIPRWTCSKPPEKNSQAVGAAASSSPLQEQTFEKIEATEESLRLIQKGMQQVVWGAGGTARSVQNDVISLVGKTGTSQVYRITKEERRLGKALERPYHLQDHALFVGFGPVDAPRFAVAVIVEHGGSGGRIAAPLAKEILMAAEMIVRN